ncbi:DHHC palmitoyltransferase-domain-containing protein [Cokeromyces recurvatus]|uniref:DHHC palmitoyltransferase-domain-containing protein n=1 Tax=Cokeromyces recurvatus TaxID=90255 RepID=UPI00221F4CB2|nr:DHHC palmitoyltransferase-domain-containing protein [Cokeromyces recurvatus]KAI7906625.1 DHHC palmitoyltransferase-domain-containing protein [Cokeromyces recurvatus]
MLKPACQLPLNNDKLTLEERYQFPRLYYVPSTIYSEPRVIALSLTGEEGEPLYCQKCNSKRPERMHHCRECHRCVPKMDQINGCVDDSNYKYFFLFVFYVACYCLWIEFDIIPKIVYAIRTEYKKDIMTLKFCWELYKLYLSCIYHVWKNIILMIWYKEWIPLFHGVQGLHLTNINLHWYILTALGFLFGITLLGFTLVHLYYILTNQTSIEHIADRFIFVRADFDQTGNNFEVVQIQANNKIYDIGYFKNWCSVMGSNPFLWMIPVQASKGNYGFDKIFPYNPSFCKHIIQVAQLQHEARLLNKE